MFFRDLRVFLGLKNKKKKKFIKKSHFLWLLLSLIKNISETDEKFGKNKNKKIYQNSHFLWLLLSFINDISGTAERIFDFLSKCAEFNCESQV